MYRGTNEDLRAAGWAAREHLKEHGFRHVVYAYTTKRDPTTVHVLDWDMHGFETDDEFNFWLNDVQGEADFIYAIHAM